MKPVMIRIVRHTAALLLLWVLLCANPAFSARQPIILTERVTDLSAKLLPEAPRSLSDMIQEGEQENGPFVKVLIIPSPGEQTLDEYAEQTLAAQPPGKRVDALLVISVDPPTARIATTEKAREKLNGVAVRSIIRESVMTFAREGQYYSAVEHGARSMQDVLLGKTVFTHQPAQSGAQGNGKDGAGLAAIPPYAAVTDLTGTLDARDVDSLRDELEALEKKRGSQIAVLMIPSTKPESIEEYSLRVFDAWKLGRKGIDDGVLVVAAKDDRRMRIEVGYGFEGVLTDLVAGRIIQEQMTPLFRKSDFGGGLTAGVQQIIKVIEGEQLPPVSSSEGANIEMPPTWALVLAGILFVLGVILRFWLPGYICFLATGLAVGAVFWFSATPATGLLGGFVSAIMSFVLPEAILNGGGSSSSGSGGSSGSSSGSGGGGSSGGGGASGSW